MSDNEEISPLLRNDENITFEELGLSEVLCTTLKELGYKKPTKIQQEAIPKVLEGKDVIGVALTGSGKTAAFCLPILESLLRPERAPRMFALILAPTRELAVQIDKQMKALGSKIGVKSCAIIGQVPLAEQQAVLGMKPHVIVATPGRLVDHLTKTNGFSLRKIQYVVLDEADRLLAMDFESELKTILREVPTERRTLLFSATMTGNVQKLQKAALTNPHRCSVDSKHSTNKKCDQYFIFIPHREKEVYLTYILNQNKGSSIIVFCNECKDVMRLSYMLNALGIRAIPLHGKLPQAKRLASLNKFKSKTDSILIATDVAGRGLDIDNVNLVINYSIPNESKSYVHRIGRTARAGKSGSSIAMVSQYQIEPYQRIEQFMNKKLPKYELKEEQVHILNERVNEALVHAGQQIKEEKEKEKMKRKRGAMAGGDSEEDEGNSMYKKLSSKTKNKHNNKNKKRRRN